MKVFNLGCTHDHHFEGWFGSADDYDSQLERGLIECPVCGDTAIRKLPAAPRLNLSASHSESKAVGAPTPTAEQLQALWLKMARHIRENTEDVGERFAEEARRIHYEQADKRGEQAGEQAGKRGGQAGSHGEPAGVRGIRGVATREEAEELADEGIEVFSFPMPKGSSEPLQ